MQKNICLKANFPLRKSPAERALPPLRISAALSRIPKDSPPRSTARKTSSPNFPTFISRPLKNGRNRRDKNNAVKTLRLRHKYFKPSRCPRNNCAGVAFTAFYRYFFSTDKFRSFSMPFKSELTDKYLSSPPVFSSKSVTQSPSTVTVPSGE